MAITYKTPDDIAKLRISGRLAADVLAMIGEHVKAGVSTDELDALCNDYIVNTQKSIPANVGYLGFPKTVCTSVNQVVCHGIPNRSEVLKDGDIINIDVAIIKDGYFGDTSRMYCVGQPSTVARQLVDTTYEAMLAGIREVKPGLRLAMSATRSRRSRSATAFRSCATIVATASARFITKTRRFCITASRGKACV